MRIHYGRDIVFRSNLFNQFVDNQGCLWVQTRIGFIAKLYDRLKVQYTARLLAEEMADEKQEAELRQASPENKEDEDQVQ